MFKKFACFAVVGLAVASTGAQAGTDTGTMAVSATIDASCTLTTNPLPFGSMTSTNISGPAAGRAVDATTTVTVTCSSDSPFNIGITNGLNASGAQRRMASGGNFLNYEVYVDGPGANAYGAISNYGTANNYNSPGTGNSGANVVTIYGSIPVQPTPASGAYSDTLTIDLRY